MDRIDLEPGHRVYQDQPGLRALLRGTHGQAAQGDGASVTLRFCTGTKMKFVRRIHDEAAGFIKDVSDNIAVEAWKDPGLVPDLSKSRTLFVFSDYSRLHGHYKTYCFFVFGRSGADYFNGARKRLREEFRLANRRMSFKGLGDKLKLNALPAFLSIAGAMEGFVLTFAVDSRIPFMFADQWLEAWPELSSVKKHVLEDMLRVVHFGAQAVMTAFCPGQNVVWFTDCDNIVANEATEQLFGRIAEATIRTKFIPEEKIGRIAFGLTAVDDGSLEIEDFASVPDLVAGALCETLDRLAEANVRITPKLVLTKPNVSKKTNAICEWIGKERCPLKKFGVVFDKTGAGEWDWRPTLFRVLNMEISACEITCNVQRAATFLGEPVRFDIADYDA